MNETEVLDVGREAIWVMIRAGGPLMILALVIGLLISIFQALTQIQESTLTFVPKLLVLFAGMLLFLPYMLSTLRGFTLELFGPELVADWPEGRIGLLRSALRQDRFADVTGKMGEVTMVGEKAIRVTAQGGQIEVFRAKAEDGKKGDAADVARSLGLAAGGMLGT